MRNVFKFYYTFHTLPRLTFVVDAVTLNAKSKIIEIYPIFSITYLTRNSNSCILVIVNYFYDI